MKRFFLLFLVFAVLMGGLTCIADDDDAIFSLDIEDDENDIVAEEIEDPVKEIEFLLGEGILEDINLLSQEDNLTELQDEVFDILFPEEQAEEPASNSLDYVEAANSNYESNRVAETFTKHVYTKENIDRLCQDYSFKNDWYWGYDSTIAGAETAYTGIDKEVATYNSNGENWKKQRYRGYDYGGGNECFAFIAFVGNHLSGLSSGNPYADNSTWAHYSYEQIEQLGGLQIGDIVQVRKQNNEYVHWAMIYSFRPDGYIETLQAYGRDHNRIKIGECFSSGVAGKRKNKDEYKDLARQYKVVIHRDRNAIPPCPIESIKLSNNNVTLNVSKNETITLKATISPSDATIKRLKWSSDNDAIVTVTQDGLIQPVAVGETFITCAAQDGSGKTASCKVIVTNFKLNKDKLDMYIGQNYTLEGWIGKTCVDCSFKSSNSKVVSVDKKGKLTAKKAGSAKISVTASKNRGTATCVVTVHPKPKKVSIKQGSSKTLKIGDSLALSITYAPKDALAKVTWKSSDKKVATVSSDGTVTAKKEGTATITAKVSGMKKGGSVKKKIKITVTDPNKPTGISISSPSETVQMGETLQLSAALKPKTAQSDVSWKSSNTKIAKVSKKGVVTPVKVGTVTITATAAKKSPKGKNVSATIKLTVKKSSAPESISVGTPKKSMYVGDKWSLDYKIKPSGAKASLTFTSSDESVATVSKKGVINALKKGTTTITVKTQNNKKATCKVTVKKKPTLQLDKESLSMSVGDTYSLTCFVSGGNGEKITFSSSDKKVATVDENGVITAVGVGKAVVSATMYNANPVTCEVTVKKVDTVTGGDLSVYIGESIQKVRNATGEALGLIQTIEPNVGPYMKYGKTDGLVVWTDKNDTVVAIEMHDNYTKYNICGINPTQAWNVVRNKLADAGWSRDPDVTGGIMATVGADGIPRSDFYRRTGCYFEAEYWKNAISIVKEEYYVVIRTGHRL